MSLLNITDDQFKEIERSVFFDEQMERRFPWLSIKYIKEHIDQFKNMQEYQTDLSFREYIDNIDTHDVEHLY